MTKTFLKYICALSVGLSSNVAFGGAATVTPSAATQKGPGTGTKTGSGASNGIETTGGGQPSVNDSADKTKDSNSDGKAMSFLTGGMFIAMGTADISAGYSSSPVGWGLVAKGVMEVMLGLLSMKQGGAHGKSSNMAGLTGFDTDGLGDLNTGGGTYDPSDLGETAKDPHTAAVANNIKKLESMGVLDAKKGTATVNGKTYKLSDFASKESMAAAGIPPGAIDGLMSLAGAIEKKAAEKMEKLKLGSKTAANGFEEGGGGGISGSGPSDSTDDSTAGGAYASNDGAGRGALDRDPSSLAGMQKNYNGEPIGVAADSIFLMMTRRYKVKESQESFFTDAELALQK
ncbi:hypothetical protein AZI87_06330 [Bdellovibrio bacteriovorus]|uniref:Uncharacterized protein n=1 Tax=Bdellovibrio bacteriovorus TaxID=959 RepID=A0A162GSA8_BDEBC|nr:hypothetical protein [Bdellovibrio bacteriovorus]KYG68842.1 hypothetical protein AZI87_06330 [Bdellovibrio bacteriovorus]